MVLKKGTPGEMVKKERQKVRRWTKNKEAPKKYYTGFLGLSIWRQKAAHCYLFPFSGRGAQREGVVNTTLNVRQRSLDRETVFLWEIGGY